MKKTSSWQPMCGWNRWLQQPKTHVHMVSNIRRFVIFPQSHRVKGDSARRHLTGDICDPFSCVVSGGFCWHINPLDAWINRVLPEAHESVLPPPPPGASPVVMSSLFMVPTLSTLYSWGSVPVDQTREQLPSPAMVMWWKWGGNFMSGLLQIGLYAPLFYLSKWIMEEKHSTKWILYACRQARSPIANTPL